MKTNSLKKHKFYVNLTHANNLLYILYLVMRNKILVKTVSKWAEERTKKRRRNGDGDEETFERLS